MAEKKLTMGQMAALTRAAAKKVDSKCDVKIRTLAQLGVGHMKKEIQNLHAVDTGTMLNSVSAESSGANTILIGPTVNYAAFVALGTSRMAARPFHTNTVKKLQEDARELFGDLDLGI